MHSIEDLTDNDIPTANFKQASFTGKAKKLVTLSQESLGARVIGGLVPASDKLTEIPIEQRLIEHAKAHALFGSLAYSKQLYQLTDE